MTTKSIPPNLINDINLFVVDEVQKEAIVIGGIEPQNANIGAGVIKPDSTSDAVEVTVGEPVGDLYLVIFNRSTVPTEYDLVIYNGEFR